MKTINNNIDSIIILDDVRFYIEFLRKHLKSIFPQLNFLTFLSPLELGGYINKSNCIFLLDYHLGYINDKAYYAHEIINKMNNEKNNQPIILMSSSTREELLIEYQNFRNLAYVVKNDHLLEQISNKINDFLTPVMKSA